MDIAEANKVSTQYKILKSTESDTLQSEVGKKLNEGWKLYGDLNVVSENGHLIFVQAIILVTTERVKQKMPRILR